MQGEGSGSLLPIRISIMIVLTANVHGFQHPVKHRVVSFSVDLSQYCRRWMASVVILELGKRSFPASGFKMLFLFT